MNKPAGLVVHPAAGHADGTLVNALLAHARRWPRCRARESCTGWIMRDQRRAGGGEDTGGTDVPESRNSGARGQARILRCGASARMAAAAPWMRPWGVIRAHAQANGRTGRRRQTGHHPLPCAGPLSGQHSLHDGESRNRADAPDPGAHGAPALSDRSAIRSTAGRPRIPGAPPPSCSMPARVPPPGAARLFVGLRAPRERRRDAVRVPAAGGYARTDRGSGRRTAGSTPMTEGSMLSPPDWPAPARCMPR